MSNFNNLTHANHCLAIGSQMHTLSVYAAKERQLRRAQTRDLRHRRRQHRLSRCLDAALTTAMVLGYLAAVVLLALWLQ